MSDSGHGKGQGEKNSGDSGKSAIFDNFLKRIMDYVSEGIARLIAFILVVVSIGAIFGYVVSQRNWNPAVLLFPAALGIIAYFERDIAIILFVALLLLVIL